MKPLPARAGARILGAFVDAVSWEQAPARILDWAHQGESRTVVLCNVHVLVSAGRDAALGAALEDADLALADGAPVAWMLRRLGYAGQARIDGPGLVWRLCERAQAAGMAVYFYGAAPATLEALRAHLADALPRLRIAGMHSPPFRPLSEAEDAAALRAIEASGAGIVFVGLGCPKQELWMAAHRGRLRAVMLGVGAAFDFHAGTLRRAPAWMRRAGLEWLHRLACEPRRLWRRYLATNTLFVLGAARQLWRCRAFSRTVPPGR